jgi:hypothetical protein
MKRNYREKREITRRKSEMLDYIHVGSPLATRIEPYQFYMLRFISRHFASFAVESI